MNPDSKRPVWYRRWVRQRTREAKSVSLLYVGTTYAGALVFYVLLGYWLDKKLGSSPWLTLVGAVVGAVGGFLWVYREVMRAGERERKENAVEDQET